MKFLMLVVLEATDTAALVDFIERLKDHLRDLVREISFVRLEKGRKMPWDFYMPCPRDGSLTRMQTLGRQYQEVYQGTCKNGHGLEFVDLDELDDDP